VLRGEMARHVMWDSRHPRFDTLKKHAHSSCSWCECVLHFAIAAIRRTTRKTSLKGHTQRVIRLYVTRPPPSRIQLNVMEMSGTFVRGNSVYVPVKWSFSSKRGQQELLLILFWFCNWIPAYAWKHAFNRITSVFSHRKILSYIILTIKKCELLY